MQLGRVIGTATSTLKHPTFEGERLLVVQLETATGGPDGEPILAFDRLGARRGDLVMLTNDGRALQELLGYKFLPVSGFPSTADIFLAMERREVDGVCEALDSIMSRRPDWLASKKVSGVLQGGVEPDPKLKDVPFVLDLARNAEERQAIAFLYAGEGIGRPYVAPPDLPEGRLAVLRNAFDATMQDADFIKDAANQKFTAKPRNGAYLEALVKHLSLIHI